MNTKINWMAGFLTGGAIGAIAAFLTAPRSGEKTRRIIREKGLEVRDGAVQALEDGRERMDSAASEVRRRFDNLKSVGEDMLDKEKALLEKSAQRVAKAVKG
jgi:gas vesicle protein